MIWMLLILQTVLLILSGWVYKSYFMQSKVNHPPIFWNPMARFMLVNGIPLALIGNTVLAFLLTDHPWWFAIASFVGFVVCVGKKQR